MRAIGVAVAGHCPQDLSVALRVAGIEPVAYLRPGDELDRVLRDRLPDVLVCLVGEENAAGLVRLVEAAAGRVPILVVSERVEPAVIPLIEAGATGYLSRQNAGDNGPVIAMLGALAAAAAAGNPPGDLATSMSKLSPREREALVYIAAGYTHRQTARRMCVSQTTVDTFVARIKSKLGVGNKADLTRAALAAVGQVPAPRRPAT